MDRRLNSKLVNGRSNLRAIILPIPEAVIVMYAKSRKRKKKLPHKFVTGARNKYPAKATSHKKRIPLEIHTDWLALSVEEEELLRD
jgi:hypothetical protein